MKILIWSVVLALLGYIGYRIYTEPEPPVVFKMVAYKMAPVEEDAGRRFGRTVYYLIATDSSFINVEMRTYARTQVGQRIGSRYWSK